MDSLSDIYFPNVYFEGFYHQKNVIRFKLIPDSTYQCNSNLIKRLINNEKCMGIKFILYGISLILFFFYAQSFQNTGETASFFETIILTIGSFSPLVGIVLCAIGLFIKEK